MKRFSQFVLTLLVAVIPSVLFAQAPTGEGWTSEEIAEGISYYTFSGMDPVSGSAQQVFVIDLDLDNPKYVFRFSYSPKQWITSDVFKTKKAIVALNAAYEPESVVIKVDGQLYSCMPKDTVMTTPVPNWKSEAAIYTDGERDVRIAFEGKDLDIAAQRAFYASSTEQNIFTSAPMLVDNFDPVGERFVDPSLSGDDFKQFNYEDPTRHQGVRHPRSAVALTKDHHLLLVAVDGRRKGIGEGMSARELTGFLVSNFNPQYAINMDGGGSTTLCVRGQGDPDTHVVNYPTDNKRAYDHAGERFLFTHFYIAEREEPWRAAYGKPYVRKELLTDWTKASGLDNVYDFSPKKSTPAPKGYKPVYVSHYGRHGSRYAYTDKAYTVLLDMLREGNEKDNLTPYGEKLFKQLDAFWEKARYQVGDLTPLGWQQHQKIAETMVKSFPTAFGKGSRIDACSSASVRAIISMSSSISSFSRNAPQANIYAHQGTLDIQATRPNTGKNPFRYTGPEMKLPYDESSESFFLRHFPEYRDVLARMFKDPDAALGSRSAYDVFFNLYMFVGGMNSIPEEERMDVAPIFTPEEYVTLWETDNYERFREYYPYQQPCASIVDDIIAKADARLAAGETGADLRFGHDHVVMSLLMLMDIDAIGTIPASQDDLACWFQTFRSPMGANIQFVFYLPKKNPKPENALVKVLLNGEEASFGNLLPYSGPYYKWTDVKEYLESRISMYVTR
ncbi:MAG: phosphodiester glycosidase family protein [Bacteroidales bacterium]|nr:phosphodiester glycosidase family protein [Bacteroidales bacterium]